MLKLNTIVLYPWFTLCSIVQIACTFLMIAANYRHKIKHSELKKKLNTKCYKNIMVTMYIDLKKDTLYFSCKIMIHD